jgi:hypothetical protein
MEQALAEQERSKRARTRRRRPKCLHRQTFQRLIPGDFGPAADQAVDAEVMVAVG